jgi:O-antigen ligase
VLSPFRARIDLLARPVPPVYADFTDVLLFWSDLAVLATLVLWAVAWLARPAGRRRLRLGPRVIAWPAAGLLAIAWVGTPFALDPTLAFATVARFSALALLGLYVVNRVRDPRRLALPVAAMVALQAAVALVQVAGQASVGLARLGELRLAPNLPVSVVTLADGTRQLRAYGLADHPNILGGVLALGLVVLAGAWLFGRVRGSRGRRLRGLSLPLLFALGAAGLFVTFSRAAWLGFVLGAAAGLAILALARPRSRLVRRGLAKPLAALGVATAVAVVPLVVVFLPALAARSGAAGAVPTEVRSVAEREALLPAVVRVATDHPVLGVGIGGLPLALDRSAPDFPFDIQPASLVPLDVTAETGVGGGALYLVLLVAPWLALARAGPSGRAIPALATASALLVAIGVVGLLDYYPWSYEAGRIWSWLALGAWASAFERARVVRRSGEPATAARALARTADA